MTVPVIPWVLKAKRISGKNLILRDAAIEDAAFILGLRTGNQKSQFLSNTAPEISKQIAWLEGYACKSDQAYFIIENRMGESLGCVRLYDPQGDSFCWGSWILKDGVPQSSAIESALIVYAYAFDHLGFKKSHFDVRKGNESVWQFHERFGATRVAETEQDFLYTISQETVSSARQRYKKFLPWPIVVEPINEH